MALQFSAWPPGSVDKFRRIAIELARRDGELGPRQIASLTDRARGSDLSGFDDITVTRFIDAVLETPELDDWRGKADVHGIWVKMIADIGDDRHARTFLIRLAPDNVLEEQGLFRDAASQRPWSGSWRERTDGNGIRSMILTIDHWVATVERVNDDLYRGVEVGPLREGGVETGVLHDVVLVRLNPNGIHEPDRPGLLPAALQAPLTTDLAGLAPRIRLAKFGQHTASVLEVDPMDLSVVEYDVLNQNSRRHGTVRIVDRRNIEVAVGDRVLAAAQVQRSGFLRGLETGPHGEAECDLVLLSDDPGGRAPWGGVSKASVFA